MIVAAGGGSNTEKNSVEKEAHGRFLGKKPGMTDGAQDDVCQHHNAKTRNGDSTQHHQEVFKRIERTPFQMALLLQDQAVEAHLHFPNVAQRLSATGYWPVAFERVASILRCGRERGPSRRSARDPWRACPGLAC